MDTNDKQVTREHVSDPAAIMVEHKGHTSNRHGEMCVMRAASSQPNCLPYRLAADLAEANRKLATRWQQGYREGYLDCQNELPEGNTRNPYRAAMGRDQGQPKRSCTCDLAGCQATNDDGTPRGQGQPTPGNPNQALIDGYYSSMRPLETDQ